MLYSKSFYKLFVFVVLAISIGLSAMNQDEERVVLEAHSVRNNVRVVAYSPNGELIASGSHNKKINIFKTDTNKIYKVLEDHSGCRFISGKCQICSLGNVISLDFSPDSMHLVSSHYTKIKIWNIATGKCIRTLKVCKPKDGFITMIGSVCYSLDGKNIASGGLEEKLGNVIRIWDIENGNCIKRLEGYNKSCASVIYSPDGRLIAGTSGNEIKIWSVETAAIPAKSFSQ